MGGALLAGPCIAPSRRQPRCTGPCRHCHRWSYRRGDSCGRRDCPGFIDTWLADWRTCIGENVRAYGGDVVMAVVTAPGASDGMPWDEAHCADRGPHKHSGPAGCRVVPAVAKRFNQTADKNLSRLHEAAYQRTYRRWGAGALWRLAVVPELHRRGVMHWHLVLAAGSAVSLAAAQFYVRQLAELAGRYGFGYVDRGKVVRTEGGRVRALRTQPASQVAGYIAKYLTKDGAASLRELVVTGEAPRRAAHVHRELTMRTRWTMRNQRRRRYVWRVWRVPVTAVEAERLLELAAAFDGELVHHRQRGDPTEPPIAK